MKKISILLLSTLTCVTPCSFAKKPPKLTYESYEHIFMGDQLALKGLPKPLPGKIQKFTLANGLQLSYGDIVAMPDYYGDPNHQVSSDSTFTKRKEWAAHLFNSFSNYDVKYFHAFWPVVQQERERVITALRQHRSVSKMYKATIGKELITLELVTNLKFFALAQNCFDHFGHDAWLAYQAGHSVAIDTAISGYKIKFGEDSQANDQCKNSKNQQTCLDNLALNKLKLAYAQNAYMNHFLTDRLTSSHMRTPFRALVQTRSLPAFGAIAGNFMHNEDGDFGLIVTNSTGKYWMAYGDDYYFSPENKAYRQLIKQILQLSADEIYDAYQFGYDPDPHSDSLYMLMPKPIHGGETVDVPGVGKVTQAEPLMKVVGNTVWERKDVNNRFDNEWAQNWSAIQLLLTYHLKRPNALWQKYLAKHYPSIEDKILKQS